MHSGLILTRLSTVLKKLFNIAKCSVILHYIMDVRGWLDFVLCESCIYNVRSCYCLCGGNNFAVIISVNQFVSL